MKGDPRKHRPASLIDDICCQCGHLYKNRYEQEEHYKTCPRRKVRR